MPDKVMRSGMRVTVGGKRGAIMEIADKIKVKFDSGDFGFFDPGQVEPFNDNSTLKASPQVYTDPESVAEDPQAQPKRKTGRGPGDKSRVLGT